MKKIKGRIARHFATQEHVIDKAVVGVVGDVGERRNVLVIVYVIVIIVVSPSAGAVIKRGFCRPFTITITGGGGEA